MTIDKNLYGYLSLVFVVLSSAPYIYSILIGKTKPHIFTQVIWALSAGIAAAGQFAGHAGPGSWAAALTASFSLIISGLSFSHGERFITRSDWIAFWTALSAIPLWYVTDNPLIAVALVTFVDVVGYYPTFRKSWRKPKEEMAFSYVVSNVKHITSLFAMTAYSATTMLYPSALFVANGALIVLLLWRRVKLEIRNR